MPLSIGDGNTRPCRHIFELWCRCLQVCNKVHVGCVSLCCFIFSSFILWFMFSCVRIRWNGVRFSPSIWGRLFKSTLHYKFLGYSSSAYSLQQKHHHWLAHLELQLQHHHPNDASRCWLSNVLHYKFHVHGNIRQVGWEISTFYVMRWDPPSNKGLMNGGHKHKGWGFSILVTMYSYELLLGGVRNRAIFIASWLVIGNTIYSFETRCPKITTKVYTFSRNQLHRKAYP